MIHLQDLHHKKIIFLDLEAMEGIKHFNAQKISGMMIWYKIGILKFYLVGESINNLIC